MIDFKKPTLEERKIEFSRAFKQVLKPRDQSDRTCLRNLANWLVEECRAGNFDEEIFIQVLGWVHEVSVDKRDGHIRNPWAVMMSILKKELGYKKGE